MTILRETHEKHPTEIELECLEEMQHLQKKINELHQTLHEELKRVPFLHDQKKVRQAELEEFQTKHKKLNKKYNLKERELEEAQSTLEKHAHTEGLKVPLEALETEKKHLKTKITTLEDHNIKLLDELDKVDEKIKGASDYLGSIDGTIDEVQKEIHAEEKSIKDRVVQLEERIEALKEQLSTRGKTLIKHLKNQKLFPYLAPTREAECSNCGMKIPQQIFEKIKKLEHLETCSQCSRIVYLKT